jgi:hypothetical protein
MGVEIVNAFSPKSGSHFDSFVLLMLEIFAHKHNYIPPCLIDDPYTAFSTLIGRLNRRVYDHANIVKLNSILTVSRLEQFPSVRLDIMVIIYFASRTGTKGLLTFRFWYKRWSWRLPFGSKLRLLAVPFGHIISLRIRTILYLLILWNYSTYSVSCLLQIVCGGTCLFLNYATKLWGTMPS